MNKKDEKDTVGAELLRKLMAFYGFTRPIELANYFEVDRQKVNGLTDRKNRDLIVEIIEDLVERANAANQKQAQAD